MILFCDDGIKMKDLKKALMILTAIIFLIIGFVMFLLWYLSTGMIAPGSSYPSVAPFYVILLSFLFLFSGFLILLWKVGLKLTRPLKLLVTAIILCFFLIGGYSTYNEYYIRYTLPSFEFQPDATNNSLTLIEFNPGDFENYLTWDDIVVTQGNATLPSGHIRQGDVITNCSGIIKIYVLMPGFTGHTFLYSYKFT